MKARLLSVATAALLALVVVPRAEARNFHVAGGIQYVAQGGQERAKGNEADAVRIYGKAVAQLTQGLQEDADDLEAWDYLGVAYAELDSAEKAGWAFGQGIEKARAKGEERKKLLARVLDNREHYWVLDFNKAIGIYQKAMASVPEGKEPDPAVVAPAIDAMRLALAMNPENPKTYCNLAAFLANARRTEEALEIVKQGLSRAPNDSCLLKRKEQIGVTTAVKAAESGEYGPAIAAFEKTLAANPQDASTAQSLGELYFKQGSAQEDQAEKESDAAKKKDLLGQARVSFTGAAKIFGKYHELKPEDENGSYNYTIALLRSGNAGEGAKMAQALLSVNGASPEYHALMATAYRDLKVDDVAAAHTLIHRLLKEGDKATDPAGFAQKAVAQYGATSEQAKRLKELGPPEEIRTTTMGDYLVEAWFWYGKKRATLFSKGKFVTEADWNTLAAAAPKPSPSTKPPAGRSKGR